jgi:hypothetical protein
MGHYGSSRKPLIAKGLADEIFARPESIFAPRLGEIFADLSNLRASDLPGLSTVIVT